MFVFKRGGRVHRRLLCLMGYGAQVRVRWRGSVQGVGFRRWVAKRARTHGVRGWVRNRDDDAVEAVLSGPLPALERVLRKAWTGPSAADVEHVRLKFTEEDVPLGFLIRRAKIHPSLLEPLRRASMLDLDSDDDTIDGSDHVAIEPFEASESTQGWAQRLRRAFGRRRRFDASSLLSSDDTAGYIERAMQYLGPLVRKPNTYRRAKVKNPFIAFRQVAKEKGLAFQHFGADPINMYTIRRGRSVELFTTGMSSRVTTPLRVLVNNKELTKAWLAAHGLPVARGGVVTDVEEGLAWFETLERDAVVKPIIGFKGRGISVGLRDPDDFRTAFAVAQTYNERVLVEETIRGIDLRVVVIDGTARAAVLRVPASVVGDGRSSVTQLVERKNRERLRNPHLALRPLRINDNAQRLLRAQGLSADARPALGQRVFLTLTANLAAGGDSVAVFDRLHRDTIALAEAAARSFGRALYLGVDILLERLDVPPDQQRCAICEINTNASPNVTHYPAYGASFDAATGVVDHVLAGAKRNSDSHEAAFEVVGPTHVASFERWLARKMDGSAQLTVRAGETGLQVSGKGPMRAVESLADVLWMWPGIGGAHVDGVRRVSRAFQPTSVGIAQDVRPPVAQGGSVQRLLDATLPRLGSEHDPDAALLVETFERRGWQAQPRGEGWYLLTNGSTSGLFGIVQAGLAVTRLARLRFPLLRWLSDSGFPTPRHVVFGHTELDRARAYHRWRGVPQRLGWVWEGPAWQRRVTSDDELVAAWGTWPDDVSALGLDAEERRALRNLAWDEWHLSVRHMALDDEDALARAWGVWPLRVRGLVLEDEVPGELVTVVVVAGRGEVIGGADAAARGLDEPARESCRQRAEAVVASLPNLDLAVVRLRLGDAPAAGVERRWTVVDVDCTPALQALERIAAGAAASIADRVVSDLALSDRTFWFGAAGAASAAGTAGAAALAGAAGAAGVGGVRDRE